MIAVLVVLARLGGPPPADLPLSVPPDWAGRVLYCQTFERADGAPDVCRAGLAAAAQPALAPDGMRGRCGRTGGGQALRLEGSALSPHRPLALSFWWRLRADATKETGFGLAHLAGPRGFVSLFVRSGPWCGLDRPAAVLQVYNLPGIVNVNAIYDRQVLDRGELRAGVWHHMALVITGAGLLAVWTDGRKVCEVRVVGRTFREDDALRSLEIGSADGPGVDIDEVVVLAGLLTSDEIVEYERAVRQMRAAGYPAH